MGARLQRLVFWGLGFVLCLAPLPFGSNRAWGWGTMALTVAVLLLLWSLAAVAPDRARPFPLRRLAIVAVPFALVALWSLVQTLPFLPQAWSNPFWAIAADALHVKLAGTISLEPEASRVALLRLLTYGGVFWLAVQLGQDVERGNALLRLLVIAGGAYAAYGLVNHILTGSRTTLWYTRPSEYLEPVFHLSSTFIYYNNYATYAGMGLLAALLLMFQRVHERANNSGGARAAAREFILGLFDGGAWLLVCMVLMTTALFLTTSRAGTVAFALGFVALLIALRIAGLVGTRHAFVAGGIAALPLLALLMLSGGQLFDRLALIATSFDERERLLRNVIAAFVDQPWRGWGHGTYSSVYFLYRDMQPGDYFDKAHNTYVENLADFGLVAGMALNLVFVALFAVALMGVLRRKRNRHFACLTLAILTQLAWHSAVDFPLQIPALAVTFAVLAGIGFAQSWSTSGGAQA